MKKLLCIAAVLTMLFGITSCGEAKKFYGNWHLTLNVADVYNKFILKESDNENEAAAYLKIDKLMVKYTAKFGKDGNYCIEANSESFDGAYEEMIVKASAGIRKYYEIILEEKGYKMDVDAYLDASGIDAKTITRQLVNKEKMRAAMPKYEGKFYVDGNMLYLTDGKAHLDPETYSIYEIKDKETIELIAHRGKTDGVMKYPYTFTRLEETE